MKYGIEKHQTKRRAVIVLSEGSVAYRPKIRLLTDATVKIKHKLGKMKGKNVRYRTARRGKERESREEKLNWL